MAVAPPTPATPAPKTGPTDDAEQALADGDYDAAIAAAVAAQARGGLNHGALVDVTRIEATARAFAGDVDGAAGAFTRLLTFAPEFTVPYTASPKVTGAFERARQQKRPPIRVDVAGAAVAVGEGCGVKVVRAVDVDDAVAALEVIAVRGGASDTARVAAPPLGKALVRPLPQSHCAPGVVHVSVVARDRAGSALVVGAPVAVNIDDGGAQSGGSADLSDGGGAVTVAVVIGVVVVAVGVGVGIAFALANSAPPDEVPLTLEVRR